MSDKLSREKRSWNMSHIRSKDTSIEVKVRKFLFSKGFRYRKNDSKLPGKPDIVLPKYKTVIFVHGCYWHRHPGCKNCTMPSTNTDFWIHKFNKNVQNDILYKQQLEQSGWHVITLWECEIEGNFNKTMESVLQDLSLQLNNQPG